MFWKMLDLQEDTIFHKKYNVAKQLGKGAFGVVYLFIKLKTKKMDLFTQQST